jgi:hypothetical protein
MQKKMNAKKKDKKVKQTIVSCGVTDWNGKPAKLSKKQKEDFIKGCSNGGEYKAIYVDSK